MHGSDSANTLRATDTTPANHEETRLKSALVNIRCLPTLSGAPTIPEKGSARHGSCHLRRHRRSLRSACAAPFAPDSPVRLAHRLDCSPRWLRTPNCIAARAAHHIPDTRRDGKEYVNKRKLRA